MSLVVKVNGTAIANAIPPESVQSQHRAQDGDAGFGGFSIDDPDALITTTGHNPVTVEESACSQPRLFTGYLTERDTGRSTDRGMIAGEDARAHDVTMVDLNSVFAFRTLTYSPVKRPEETVAARLTWLLGHWSLASFIEDTGHVSYPTLVMDAADYTGGTAAAVLADLCERVGGTYTYFAFWDPVAAAVGLYFGPDGTGIGESSLYISNDLSDIDGVTTFAPDTEAQLVRTPEEVYSEVVVEFAHGTKRIYRSRASTVTAYGIARGTTIQRPYTGKVTTAQAQADGWLTKHSVERDTITTAILVPPGSAGLAVAGQRINVKFTHLPGYEAWTSMRIVTSDVQPVDDTATLYRIGLVLEMPVAGTAPCACSETMELVQYMTVGGDDYALDDGEAITLSSPPTCGNLLVMIIYARDITDDDPSLVRPIGFTNLVHSYYDAVLDIPRAKYIGVFYRYVEEGDGATWTADYPTVDGSYGSSSLIYLAEYSGVEIDTGTPVRAMRENDLSPDFPAYTPGTTRPTIICAAVHWQPGQGQSPTDYSLVFDSGDPGAGNRHRMALWDQTVASPSGSYTDTLTGLTDDTTDTHIVQFGLVECAGDEEETLEPPVIPAGSPVLSTSDPTADDDESEGYQVGQLWQNTTTGEVFILTDATDGAAVWSSINAGGTASSTVESETTLGIAPAAGSSAEYSRGDHTHGSPTTAALEAVGLRGELLVADGTSGPNGILPSSYVEMETPDSTTSGTLEDLTGATTTITLQRAAHVAAWLNCHVSATAVCDYGLAINFDGTDHDEAEVHLTSVDAGNVTVVHRTETALPPGTYTIKGRHRRVGGGGTPQTDRADLLVIAMATDGPVTLTNEAEDDYLYANLT